MLQQHFYFNYDWEKNKMRILPNKKENAHVFLLVRAGDAIHKINFTWPYIDDTDLFDSLF